MSNILYDEKAVGSQNETKREDDAHIFGTSEAIQAEHAEKELTLWNGLKLYRKAVLWSVCFSALLIMEGYDTSLLGNALALPIFRQHYGKYSGDPKKGYQISAPWQSGLSQASTVGNILGIFIASWAQDRYGYRRTIQVGLVAITGFIFIVYFAPSVQVLMVGELLCGFPWGAFSSGAVAYASEVTPVSLRGYLTTYVNLCWIIGQFIAAGVVYAVKDRTDALAYRLPFALQWIWPVPLFILITLAPESPWWLVRKGRLEEAERSVARLATTHGVSPTDTVAMMVRTNRIEQEMKAGEGTYLDCFRGANLRRTEIACVAWASTVLAGSSFANHPAYFLEQAGLSTTAAFQINLGQRGLGFLGTLLSWIVMTYFGRRVTFLSGLTVCALTLLITGILSFPGQTNQGARWGQAVMMLIWVFVWDFSVTVTAYAIVGEASSTRTRAKTVGLARNLYNVHGIVAGILNTYQVNAIAWNWQGKAGFFWFGSCLIALVWAYFRLPEMKGRTFRELDILFDRGVSARKFKETIVADEDEA